MLRMDRELIPTRQSVVLGRELPAVVDAHGLRLPFNLNRLTNQLERNRIAVGIKRDQIIRGHQPREAYVREKARMAMSAHQVLTLSIKSVDRTSSAHNTADCDNAVASAIAAQDLQVNGRFMVVSPCD